MDALEHYPTLSNAPIVEALIDIKYSTKDVTSFEFFDELYSEIKERYSVKQENKEFSVEFAIDPESGTRQSVSEKLIGYRYDWPERKFVLQLARGGFTLSKLAPYETWDELRNEAEYLWGLLRGKIADIKVIRTAVRYINRIEIFEKYTDFEEYLTAGPRVPAALPQSLKEFLTRNVIPFPDKSAIGVVSQALDVANSTPDKATLILDIDVFKSGEHPSNIEEFWSSFESLRGLKNKVFFSSLTPRTLELFK